MKNKTGKKDGSGALALAPVGLSLLAAHAQSLWLAAAAGILILSSDWSGLDTNQLVYSGEI